MGRYPQPTEVNKPHLLFTLAEDTYGFLLGIWNNENTLEIKSGPLARLEYLDSDNCISLLSLSKEAAPDCIGNFIYIFPRFTQSKGSIYPTHPGRACTYTEYVRRQYPHQIRFIYSVRSLSSIREADTNDDNSSPSSSSFFFTLLSSRVNRIDKQSVVFFKTLHSFSFALLRTVATFDPHLHNLESLGISSVLWNKACEKQ